MTNWAIVKETVRNAKSMHWDGCHKIYLAMDDEETKVFEEYEYETFAPDYDLLTSWYDASCGLRFVNAVYHNERNPNVGFVTLIAQFEDEEDEEEDY